MALQVGLLLVRYGSRSEARAQARSLFWGLCSRGKTGQGRVNPLGLASFNDFRGLGAIGWSLVFSSLALE